MDIKQGLMLVIVLVCAINGKADGGGRVIFGVNAGGEGHVDVNGVNYQKDPLKIGIASDYGKHLLAVGRVHPNDQVLYQTERYHHSTFGYDVPIVEDGPYVMVLKFCEVYFNAPNMKVTTTTIKDSVCLLQVKLLQNFGISLMHFNVSRFLTSFSMVTILSYPIWIFMRKLGMELPMTKSSPSIYLGLRRPWCTMVSSLMSEGEKFVLSLLR